MVKKSSSKEVKIIRELAPKIKEIKPESEKAAEEAEGGLEEDVEEAESGTFSQFLKGKPAFNIPEVREEQLEQELPQEVTGATPRTEAKEEELASQRRQYQVTELGESRSRYEPQQMAAITAAERPQVLDKRELQFARNFENPELAHLRQGAQEDERKYELKKPEEKKEAKRRYPWEA